MKRMGIIIVIIFMQLGIVTLTASGDMGPKPSITINATNMPEGLVYMDILVDEGYSTYENLRDDTAYNDKMLDTLKAYNEDGWWPGIAVGTVVPMFGDIVCDVVDGACSMHYSYVG